MRATLNKPGNISQVTAGGHNFFLKLTYSSLEENYFIECIIERMIIELLASHLYPTSFPG